MFKIGDTVRILPQWQDAGDNAITFIVVEAGEDRCTIEAQLGLRINPQQRVTVEMIELAK